MLCYEPPPSAHKPEGFWNGRGILIVKADVGCPLVHKVIIASTDLQTIYRSTVHAHTHTQGLYLLRSPTHGGW